MKGAHDDLALAIVSASLPPGARVVPIEPDPRVGVVFAPGDLRAAEQPCTADRERVYNAVKAMVDARAVVLPAGASVVLRGPHYDELEPSPVARFDAWAAEGAQDRPPPGRRPWGARWER